MITLLKKNSSCQLIKIQKPNMDDSIGQVCERILQVIKTQIIHFVDVLMTIYYTHKNSRTGRHGRCVWLYELPKYKVNTDAH